LRYKQLMVARALRVRAAPVRSRGTTPREERQRRGDQHSVRFLVAFSSHRAGGVGHFLRLDCRLRLWCLCAEGFLSRDGVRNAARRGGGRTSCGGGGSSSKPDREDSKLDREDSKCAGGVIAPDISNDTRIRCTALLPAHRAYVGGVDCFFGKQESLSSCSAVVRRVFLSSNRVPPCLGSASTRCCFA
jgi:hypothetical protein